jgi:metal-responsive CopG/Arc/MetJ family transcriptional regulator
MAKRIIQVPIEESMLEDLNNLSKKHHKARAEMIRLACSDYLKQIKQEELNKIYQEGYRKIPEKVEIGKVQLIMTREIASLEPW